MDFPFVQRTKREVMMSRGITAAHRALHSLSAIGLIRVNMLMTRAGLCSEDGYD